MINAAEFKATCLAVLDEVAARGETVTIYKRGRAVAQLVPATTPEGGYAQDALRGSLEILGDIVSPVGGADACAP